MQRVAAVGAGSDKIVTLAVDLYVRKGGGRVKGRQHNQRRQGARLFQALAALRVALALQGGDLVVVGLQGVAGRVDKGAGRDALQGRQGIGAGAAINKVAQAGLAVPGQAGVALLPGGVKVGDAGNGARTGRKVGGGQGAGKALDTVPADAGNVVDIADGRIGEGVAVAGGAGIERFGGNAGKFGLTGLAPVDGVASQGRPAGGFQGRPGQIDRVGQGDGGT